MLLLGALACHMSHGIIGVDEMFCRYFRGFSPRQHSVRIECELFFCHRFMIKMKMSVHDLVRWLNSFSRFLPDASSSMITEEERGLMCSSANVNKSPEICCRWWPPFGEICCRWWPPFGQKKNGLLCQLQQLYLDQVKLKLLWALRVLKSLDDCWVWWLKVVAKQRRGLLAVVLDGQTCCNSFHWFPGKKC